MSIVWVTNLSAPYRRPVWSALADRRELWIGLLGSAEPNRRWTTDLPQNVRRLPMRTWQRNFRSASVYVLLAGTLARTGTCEAVVLPGWENPAAWQLLLECTLRGTATVAFYESTQQSRSVARGPIAAARRWFFHHVGAVITVGESSTAAVLEMGVPHESIITTHNSVDLGIFQVPDGQGVEPSTRSRRFAYVGQLIPRKNVEALFEALSAGPRDFTLDVIGEGPSRPSLEALARRLGLLDRITFAGYQPPETIWRLLQNVGTLVLPSAEEVHGLAPAEALAMGLHAVVSARAGIAADIASMPGVRIAEPDPASLAEAMSLSSLAWSGSVADPPIRSWTPDRFAEDVLRAVELARKRRRFGRK